MSCGKQVPGLGRVCYLPKLRGYRLGKARAESACEGGCMTELWTADSGKGPRVLSVSHDCDLDKSTGGAPPFAALALNGRTFFLSDVTCYEAARAWSCWSPPPRG